MSLNFNISFRYEYICLKTNRTSSEKEAVLSFLSLREIEKSGEEPECENNEFDSESDVGNDEAPDADSDPLNGTTDNLVENVHTDKIDEDPDTALADQIVQLLDKKGSISKFLTCATESDEQWTKSMPYKRVDANGGESR